MAIKITKGVINPQHSLIGFIISGKESELGGIGSNIAERSISIDEMLHNGFSNKQISIVNGRIITKNNFKINQLPMVVFNGDGYFDYDNTINLVGRIVKDNENIGFRVRFADGTEDNLKYANVIMICNWFKPENFSIRTSAKGRNYICAKQGYGSIEELPATIIGEPPTAKRRKSAAKDKVVGTKGELTNDFDIIDIYDFIDKCGGSVIKLPNEEYKAASDTIQGDGAFKALGIGEVASAKPIFSSTKLNVNAGFKKVGNVNIIVNGMNVAVPTFTFRTKSLFLNGENYMKKFGIAVPKENEAELVKTLGASLSLSKIEDLATILPISQVLGNTNLAFYKVDTSKIDLISDKKREASIKTNQEIMKLCMLMYELKLISKATGPKGGITKEIKEVLGNSFVANAKGKKVFSTYAMYTDEGLKMLESAGIDIYTGSYNAPSSDVKVNKDSASKDSISIEYIVQGYDYNKLTGTKIVGYVREGDTTKLPANVYKVIEDLLNIQDFGKRYVESEKVYKDTEARIAEINKILWMHNASMYLNGSKSRIHTHNANTWVPNMNSRVKNSMEYICNESGCESLCVRLVNVTI